MADVWFIAEYTELIEFRCEGDAFNPIRSIRQENVQIPRMAPPPTVNTLIRIKNLSFEW